MTLVAGFFVPHPPIIIPEVGNGEETKIQKTIDAYQMVAEQIRILKPDTIIITSPHAVAYRDFFHISTSDIQFGNLSRFRAPQVQFEIQLDQEMTDKIIQNAKQENLPFGASPNRQDEIDHGAMVPLYFILERYNKAKFVRLSPSTVSTLQHYQMGQFIQSCIPTNKTVVWVASGDLSHTLRADGPYGLTKEGPEFDLKFQKIVQSVDIDALFNLDTSLIKQAAVCGLGSFAMMLGAFHNSVLESKLLSYQDTFGVGYAVASFYPVEEV